MQSGAKPDAGADEARLERIALARVRGDGEAERRAIGELIAGWLGPVERWLASRGVMLLDREEIVARWAFGLVKAVQDNDGFPYPFGVIAMTRVRWAHADYFRQKHLEHEVSEADPMVHSRTDEFLEEGPLLDPEAFEDALAALSERDRQILQAIYFDDLPGAEAAQRLGIEHGTLRTALSRALVKLRKELADRGVTKPGESPVLGS